MVGSRRLGVVILLLCVSAVHAQVKLELKREEKSELTTQTQVKVKQTLNIAGMDIETSNDSFVVSLTKNGERASDGTLVTEEQVKTLQVNLDLPNGIKLQFDSGAPDKKADNALLEPLLDVYRASVKMTGRVTRDKDNKIQKFEWPQDVYDGLPEAIRKEFDPEKRKKAAEIEASFMPDKPVQKGDTWERTLPTPLGGGQTMEFVNEYTYVGPEMVDGATRHKITSKTKSVSYAMDPNVESPLKVTGSKLSPTESAGEILIDLEKGQVTKLQSRVRIEGDLTLDIGGMQLPGKLDLRMETDSRLQP